MTEMPETSFVPGWSIGVLLVLLTLVVLWWAIGPHGEDDDE